MASAIPYYNVLVLGPYTVGKTSIESWLAGDWERNERSDKALFDREFYDVRVDLADGDRIVVRLWDTLEMERDKANALPTSFFRQRDGFILVWDIRRADTLREIKELYEMALSFYGEEHLPSFVIFANKAELEIAARSEEFVSCVEWCKERRVDCFKTSSKTGHNLEEGLHRLVQLMTQKEPIGRVKKKTVDINQVQVNNNNTDNSSQMCCKL